jgi:polar amino acid transport system permease protein
MGTTIGIIGRYWPALLDGALTTIQLAIIAWLGGLVLGTVIGIVRAGHRTSGGREVSAMLALAASSVPIIVYLLWAYYPLQASLGISVPAFATAAIVFTLYNSLVVAEIVRGAILDLPLAFGIAARVNGVSRWAYLRSVVLPLGFRVALPSYLVSQVGTLHLTLFSSLISVDDLFRAVQRINSIEYDAVGVYSVLAIFYFVLSFPLLLASRWADTRLARLGLER